MKTISFLQILTLILLLALVACDGNNETQKGEQEQASQENETSVENGMHSQHESLANNFTHKDIIILPNSYSPDKEAQLTLKQVVMAYLDMKAALVNDNTSAADKAAAAMFKAVQAVSGEGFRAEGMEAWQQHASLYQDKLKEMLHIEGLENKRSYFAHISEIMYCTVKSFDLDAETLYVNYCPMAFDNRGAYWLSDSKEIENPYFGEKMLKCGEIKEVLNNH